MSEYEDYEESSISSSRKSIQVALLILGFLVIFFFKGQFGDFEIDKAVTIVVCVWVFYLLGKYIMDSWRNETNRFIGDDVQVPLPDEPMEVGSWHVFLGGGLRAKFGGLYLPIPDTIIVVPRIASQRIGNQWFNLTSVDRVTFEDLPFEVQEILDNMGRRYSKCDCYFGIQPLYARAMIPDFVEQKQEFTKANLVISRLRKYLHDKYGDALRTIDFGKSATRDKNIFGVYKKPKDDQQ